MSTNAPVYHGWPTTAVAPGVAGQVLTTQNYAPAMVGGNGVTISTGWSNEISLDLENNKEFQALKGKIAVIEDRLAIINPDNELMEKYPALKEAYDHYKLVEALVREKVTPK